MRDWRLYPAQRDGGSGCIGANHAVDAIHQPDRSTMALDDGCDREVTCRGMPWCIATDILRPRMDCLEKRVALPVADSGWWSCLARAGRVEEARRRFDKLLAHGEPPRVVLRADRTQWTPVGELSAGVDASGTDQCRDVSGPCAIETSSNALELSGLYRVFFSGACWIGVRVSDCCYEWSASFGFLLCHAQTAKALLLKHLHNQSISYGATGYPMFPPCPWSAGRIESAIRLPLGSSITMYG